MRTEDNLLLLSELFKPLLGGTRSLGRWWATIRLSYRLEPSGHAVRREVDGLDIGRQHGRQFFCATLTGLRGGHTPFVQAGAGTSDTGAEEVKPDTGSSWMGHSGGWLPAGPALASTGPNSRPRPRGPSEQWVYDVIVFGQPCYDRGRAQIYSKALTRELSTLANVREEIR